MMRRALCPGALGALLVAACHSNMTPPALAPAHAAAGAGVRRPLVVVDGRVLVPLDDGDPYRWRAGEGASVESVCSAGDPALKVSPARTGAAAATLNLPPNAFGNSRGLRLAVGAPGPGTLRVVLTGPGPEEWAWAPAKLKGADAADRVWLPFEALRPTTSTAGDSAAFVHERCQALRLEFRTETGLLTGNDRAWYVSELDGALAPGHR